MFKKKLFLLLASALLILAMSAGCRSAAQPAPAPATPPPQANEPATTPQETPPEEPSYPSILNMDSQFPITNEVITVRGFANRAPSHARFEDMEVLNMYEEMTNIRIEWTDVPSDMFEERKNIMIATGDFPCFFWRGGLNSFDEVSLGSLGVLVPLNDLIDAHAVNLLERFEEMPGARDSITQPSGNIYSLPQFNGSLASLAQYSWIHQGFLDMLGLDMPTTTDEFFDVMLAFSLAQSDGEDILAISSRNQGNEIFRQLGNSWGFGNLGMQNTNQFIDRGPDGNIRFIATDPLYRELIEFIKAMWDAGILDREIFTQGVAEFTAKGDRNVVGAFLTNNTPSIIGNRNMHYYVAIPPLMGPHGDRMWGDIQATIQATGSFAITYRAEHPEALMRWVDHWYSEEGSIFLRMGIRGVSYDIDADGNMFYMDEITNNPRGLTTAQAQGQFSPGIGGGLAHFIFDEFERIRLEPEVFEGFAAVENYLIPYSVVLTFTLAEQERLRALTTDINTFVRESRVRFVTGAKSMDEWDNYVRQIERMGLAELLEIYNAAYARFRDR